MIFDLGFFSLWFGVPGGLNFEKKKERITELVEIRVRLWGE